MGESSSVGLCEMLENESLGIVTILKVVVGPLVLALGLAYGIYRSRHGRVGTARENRSKTLVPMAVAGLIAFCIIMVLGSVVITRSINQSAETTGSSTRPVEPRTEPREARAQQHECPARGALAGSQRHRSSPFKERQLLRAGATQGVQTSRTQDTGTKR
jgi:hypothetical protein